MTATKTITDLADTHAAARKALAELYAPRATDDETVDPDVADYVRATTEGLEGNGNG